MKIMNGFEKWQIVFMIVESMLMLGALLGAIYFGFKQQEVNTRLSQIEQYNFEQNQIKENAQIIKDKRDLRNITLTITDYFSWRSQKEKDAIQNRTYSEKLTTAKEIRNLLNEGLDNQLLKSNKESLYHWLAASNIISGIVSVPTDGHYYFMEHANGVSRLTVGPILTESELNEWKKNNPGWTFKKMDENDFVGQINKELDEVNKHVLEVHSILDLSFYKLRGQLQEELKQKTELNIKK